MFVKGEKFKIFITFIEKGCCAGQCQIWGQTNVEYYSRLESLISAHRGMPSRGVPDPSSIHKGDIVIAQYDDDSNWYRAQVLEILTGRLFMQFIDYGNKETVSLNKVIVASPELLSVPPLAELFIIAGVTPRNGASWSTSEQDIIHHNLVNAEFTAEVVADGSVGFPCSIRLLDASFLPNLVHFPMLCWPVIRPSSELDAGKVYTVYVTHCESMLDFWVQDSSIQDSLDIFHSKINMAVQDGAAPCLDDSRRRAGTVCIARYRGSDQFYRAVLKEVNWQGACVVTYLDYGDSANVQPSDLWPLPDEFIGLSSQALRCCVTAGSTTLSSSDFRHVFASGLPVTVFVRSKTLLRYLVEVMTSVKSIAHQAPATRSAVQLPSMVPVLTQYQPLKLTDATWHDVCISHVNDDGSFFVQLIENASQLNDMMTALSKRPLEPLSGSIVDGMSGVVRDQSDRCLYRAQVTALTSGCVQTRLADFGNQVECKTNELYAACYADFPMQCFHCHLEGADQRPPATVAKMLRQFESKKGLLLAVRHKSLSKLFVDLVDIDAGTGRAHRIVDQLLTMTSPQVPLPAECSLNVLETAYVSAIVSSGEFFVQLSNVDVDALEQFGTRLNEFYSNNSVPPLSRPQPGDYCCSQYSTDDLYYRAIVVREFAGQYLVSFVDYGNEEYKKQCDLFVLLPQFCSLPRQAVHCKLLPGSPASSASRDTLELKLLAKTVKLALLTKGQGDIYNVQLPECNENRSVLMEIAKSVSSPVVTVPHVDFSYKPSVQISPKERQIPSERLPGTASFSSNRNASSYNDPPLRTPSLRSSDAPPRTPYSSSSDRKTSSSSTEVSDNGISKKDTTFGREKFQRSSSQEESHSALLSFASEKITVGTWLGCVVSHVDDPENFYCQLEGERNVELLESLMGHIDKYINSLPPGIGLLRTTVLGQPVVAKFSEDGNWYRARVTGVMKVSRKLEVHFVDFGNREVVEIGDVRDMPQTLLSQLPSQAIPCSLFGASCQAVSGWSPSDVNTFRDIIDDQMLQVFFTGDQNVDGQQLVHLLKGQENVNRQFLRESGRLSVTYTSPVVREKVTNVRLGAGDAATFNKAPEIGAKQIVKFQFQSFRNNEVIKCHVAYVTSPSKFFCQLANTADDLEDLMSLLNSGSSGNQDKMYAFTPGEACCARYSEDERWYRALILQGRDRSGCVRVQFVDYGNEENVTENMIRQIKATCMKLPVQSIECTLDDVIVPATGNEWSEESATKFEELFGDDPVEVRLMSCDDSTRVHHVNIDSIVSRMVSLKLAQKKPTGQRSAAVDSGSSARTKFEPYAITQRRQTSETRPQTLPYSESIREHRQLKAESSLDIIVSHITSPVEFYCQLSETSDELDRLMQQIEDDYSKLDESYMQIDKPQVGQPCCAKYSADEAWYRGIVTEVNAAKRVIDVRFVDYGNSEWLSSTDIKYLNSNCAALPMQAVKCSLRDVAPVSNDNWSAVCLSEFEALTIDQELTAFIDSYSDGVYTVTLKNKTNKVDIRRALLDKSLVKAVQHDTLDYLPVSVSPGGEHDVVLSWFTSPADFHCQLLSNRFILEKLGNDLYDSYSKLRLNELSLKPSECVEGKPCVAYYEADGSWYRSRLITCSGGEATVLYVDYGNTEKVRLARVKDISAQFLTSPPVQGLQCCLKDSETIAWTSLQKTQLENLLSSAPMKCKFIEKRGDKFVVEVFDSSRTNVLSKVTEGFRVDTKASNEKFDAVKSTLSESRSSLVVTQTSIAAHVVPNKECDVYVSTAITPTDFYVQLVNFSEQLEIMVDQLFTEYSNLGAADKKIASPVTVGTECCAQYSEDSAWYRAVVKQVMGNECEVLFIDYGNSDTVKTSELKCLSDDFKKIAPLAMHCSLYGVARPAIGWSEADIEKFISVAECDKVFTCKFVSKSESFAVKLLEAGEDMGLKFGANYTPLSKRAPQVEIRSVKETSIAGHVVPDKECDVYVSTAITPTDFYVQLVSVSEQLEIMVDQLFTEYSNLGAADKNIASPVTVGTECCAQYSEDSAWYRAVVKQVMGNECEVLFIDYGNSDTVKTSELKCLSDDFKKIAPLAMHCSLYGVACPAIGWSEADIEKFISVAECDKVFTCKFVSKSESFAVKLLEAGEDMGLKFGANYTPLSKTAPQVEIRSVKETSIAAHVVPDKECDVYVSTAITPTDFYVQLVSVSEQLEIMVDQLFTEYSNLGAADKRIASPVTVGTECCAQYSEDSAWYRAVVKQVMGNECEVLFIDYGNSDTVKTSELKCLSDDFKKIAPLAMHCSLNAVSCPADGWSEENIEKFIEVAECDKVFTCKFESKSEPFAVKLLDGDDDIGVKFGANYTSSTSEALCLPSILVPTDTISVCITSTVSPTDFYVQAVGQEETLFELAEQLTAKYDGLADNEYLLESVSSGSLCCARYTEDGAWYRAVVEQVDGNSVSVIFVDYGNKDTVSQLDSIRRLDQKYATLAPFAYKCSLHGIESPPDGWTDVDVEKFVSATMSEENPVLDCKFHDSDSSCQSFTVTLSQGSLDIGNLFENCKVVSSPEKLNVDEKLADPLLAKSVSVIVTSTTSPHDFWCHIEDDASTTELPLLMDRIADLCERDADAVMESSSLLVASPGELCIAKYSDGIWYRARILSKCVTIQSASAEKIPNCDQPDVEDEVSEVDKVLSRVESELPAYDESLSDVPDELPERDLPDVEDEVSEVDKLLPYVESELPDVKAIKLSEVDVAIPEVEGELRCVEVEPTVVVIPEVDGVQPEVEDELVDEVLLDVKSQLSVVTSELPGGVATEVAIETSNVEKSVGNESSVETIEWIEVLFIDYGNTAKVSLCDLRPISGDYLILPPQAVHCSLVSIEPLNGVRDVAVWDESSRNRFVELVVCRDDKRSLEFRAHRIVRNESGHIMELFGRLFDGDTDVGSELVRGGYASSSDQNVLSPNLEATQQTTSSLKFKTEHSNATQELKEDKEVVDVAAEYGVPDEGDESLDLTAQVPKYEMLDEKVEALQERKLHLEYERCNVFVCMLPEVQNEDEAQDTENDALTAIDTVAECGSPDEEDEYHAANDQIAEYGVPDNEEEPLLPQQCDLISNNEQVIVGVESENQPREDLDTGVYNAVEALLDIEECSPMTTGDEQVIANQVALEEVALKNSDAQLVTDQGPDDEGQTKQSEDTEELFSDEKSLNSECEFLTTDDVTLNKNTQPFEDFDQGTRGETTQHDGEKELAEDDVHIELDTDGPQIVPEHELDVGNVHEVEGLQEEGLPNVVNAENASKLLVDDDLSDAEFEEASEEMLNSFIELVEEKQPSLGDLCEQAAVEFTDVSACHMLPLPSSDTEDESVDVSQPEQSRDDCEELTLPPSHTNASVDEVRQTYSDVTSSDATDAASDQCDVVTIQSSDVHIAEHEQSPSIDLSSIESPENKASSDPLEDSAVISEDIVDAVSESEDRTSEDI